MLEKLGIEGIYVVHAKKGYERHEQRINDLFSQYGLKYEFVTDGDITCFTPELLNKYFIPDIQERLSNGSISCTFNHILSCKKVVENNNKYALIFEDDPFFIGNFLKEIEKVTKEADTLEKGFIISLENTSLKFPSFKSIKKNKYLYEASYGRCAGAYLIDLVGAKNIMHYLEKYKCDRIIDWWHNKLIDNKVIKMYWAYPAFIEQCSHNGMMSSTISSRNQSLIRRFKWLVHKHYKTYILRFFK